ncbi:MAG: penicillin acylase family protein [Proteobacteria bacterium]|nr:penicillin acylase family protein [Pseudomonadota bacterium]
MQNKTVILALMFAALLLAFPCSSAATDIPEHRIEWDIFGVPYIYADTWAGLAYATGWVQAKNHGNILLVLLAQARGKSAEYFGSRLGEGTGVLKKEHEPVNLAASDRLVHLLGIRELGVQWYAEASTEKRTIVDAFARGINDYAGKFPDLLAPEVKVVLPVTGEDILSHSARILKLFQVGPRMGVVRNWLKPAAGSRSAALLDAGEAMQTAASNAWAIGPEKSADGNPMLLLNPHLRWDFNAHTYMQIQWAMPMAAVRPGDMDFMFHGIHLLGAVLPSMGINRHLGWANTVNRINTVTLYEVPVVDAGSYYFNGKKKPFSITSKTIKTRNADGTLAAELLHILRSPDHDMAPVMGVRNGRALLAHATPVVNTFEQSLAMVRATSFKGFENALAMNTFPVVNFLYAGRDRGTNDPHVYFLFAGRIPRRPHGDWDAWWNVVPGNSSKTRVEGIHDFQELPKILDPPSGWLQSTNDPPWTATFPPVYSRRDFPLYFSMDFMHLRAQRSVKLLMGKDRLSLDEFIARKFSPRNEMADRILPDLISAAGQFGDATAQKAADILAAWDHMMNSDSRGAALFLYWLLEMKTDDVMATGLWAADWDPELAADPENWQKSLDLPAGLADPVRGVQALSAAALRLEKDTSAMDAPYREVVTVAAGDRLLASGGGPGDPMGMFHAIPLPVHLRPDISGPADAPLSLGENEAGETFVMAVEFTPSGPRAAAMLTYGNASQPGSPHRGDQLHLLIEKKLRPITFAP